MNRISGVALLNLLSLVDLHVSLLATDLLDSELDSAYLENVPILYFVVNFFIVVFQTSDHKIHILIVSD